MKFYLNKLQLITLLAVGLVSLCYIALTFTDGDEGRYLYLAEAIAQGHGQTDIHLPTPQPEALTPPGYPYLISLLVRGDQLTVFGPKLFSWLIYLFYSLVVLATLERLKEIDQPLLPIITLIVLLPVSILIYSWTIFAETLYLLSSGLVLLTILRGEDDLKTCIVTGLLIALSMAVRPVGLAFIPAIGLHLLWRRKWLPLIGCALAFIACYSPVIWITYKALGVPFGYISHYASDQTPIEKIFQLLQTISIIVPHYLFDALPKMLYFSLFDGDCLLGKLYLGFLIKPLTMAMGLIIVLGFLIRIKKLHFFDLYALVYLPMVSSYHVALQRGIEDRYLLPLLPHAIFYLYLGLRLILSKLKASNTIIRSFFILSLAYILLTSLGVGSLRIKREWNQRHLGPFDPQRHLNIPIDAHQAFGRYLEAAEWIRENTEAEAIVVSRKPRHTYLISERRGFRLSDLRLPEEQPFETIARQLEKGPIYILQDAYPEDSSYGRDRMATIDPMLEKKATHFTKLHSTEAPETVIWKMEPLPTP